MSPGISPALTAPGRDQRPRLATICIAIVILCAGALAACGRDAPSQSDQVELPASVGAEGEAASIAPTASPRQLPTLYPTGTVPPTPVATPTKAVAATEPSATLIPLESIVVALRYEIPSLDLSRRLEGTIGSLVTLVDETTGVTTQLNNQAGVMMELQQAFADLDLPPVATACDACVRVSYDLPFVGRSGDGHLEDPVLLASLENYMALALGPHYPPGTVFGLRRSASPFDVAQTVAVTDEGRIFRWLATQGTVPAATDEPEILASLTQAGSGVVLPDGGFVADCPGVPIETLLWSHESGTQIVPVVCPDLSLPTTMVSPYALLDTLLAPLTADTALEKPLQPLPLQANLFYRRSDGLSLTVFDGFGLIASDATSATLETEISPTLVLSWTQALSGTGVLAPGPGSLVSGGDPVMPGDTASFASPFVLALRSTSGVLSVSWEGDAPGTLAEALEPLDRFLDAAWPTPETPTPTPAATATPNS